MIPLDECEPNNKRITPIEKEILIDRIGYSITVGEAFLIEYMENRNIHESLILLARKSNSLLEELKDKLEKK
jgi:hypothetical protein